MAKINLLPQDVVTVHKAAKITQILKVTSIFLGGTSLALGFILGGYFFYKQKTLQDLREQYESTKTQVLALESTENSLVLVRDRLSKIKESNVKYPNNKTLSVTSTMLETLPPDVLVHSFTSSAESQSVTLEAKDSVTLAKLLTFIKENAELTDIQIMNIKYNSSIGYEVSIMITNI